MTEEPDEPEEPNNPNECTDTDNDEFFCFIMTLEHCGENIGALDSLTMCCLCGGGSTYLPPKEFFFTIDDPYIIKETRYKKFNVKLDEGSKSCQYNDCTNMTMIFNSETSGVKEGASNDLVSIMDPYIVQCDGA